MKEKTQSIIDSNSILNLVLPQSHNCGCLSITYTICNNYHETEILSSF